MDVNVQVAGPRTRSKLAIGALLVLVVVEGLLWQGAERQLRDERKLVAASAAARLAAQQRVLALAEGAWRATPAVVRSHCADAMAQRAAAYRRAGKQRDYDFFRYWDEYVYSACSAPDAS